MTNPQPSPKEEEKAITSLPLSSTMDEVHRLYGSGHCW